MHRVVKWIFSVTLAFVATFVAQNAEATHFRYGNVTWSLPDPVAAPLTVEFTVTHGWRSSFTSPANLNFGDGASSGAIQGTAIGTGTDGSGEAYTIFQYTVQHTYAAPGSYTAFFSGCCRLSSLINAGDDPYRVESVVNLEADGSNTSGPISGIPVIIQMEIGGVRQFVLPVFDPDADPHTCAFSTQAQSGIGGGNPPVFNGNPLTFVQPGCTIEWDLSTANAGDVGDKYSTSIRIASDNGGNISVTTVDYIIELVPQGTVPTCTGSGNFTANVGQAFSHTVQFSEPGNGVLNYTANGIPSGASTTPAAPSTLTPPYPTPVQFDWTPTLADAGGSYLVQLLGTNATNNTGFCSLIITVPPCPNFGNPCTVGVGECQNSGTFVCVGNMTVCSATPGTPTAEMCDGLDNDCDGVNDNNPIDEGQACPSGLPGVCAAGTTVCNSPTLDCNPNVTPGTQAEICDAQDNDCDGSTDEGFNVGASCTAGLGACEATGNIICDGLGGAVCDAVPGTPMMEICANDIDESCDGVLNDGCLDSGNDGIIDEVEILIGSDPFDQDTDDDGVPDGQEPTQGGCIDFAACFGDSDGDGLNSVLDADSDNDGLLDGTEMGFDCSNPDTDPAICIADADMGATTTDPLDADTDDGGVNDGSEDTNLNGQVDGNETDPTAGNGADDIVTDSDNDGLSDDLEIFIGSDPFDADTDDDGVLDGDEPNPSIDNDGDGLINVLDVDSDNDGLYDGTELGLDCNDPATDPGPPSHCTPDGDAGATTTSPLLADTDGGGVDDGSEDQNLNGVQDGAETDPTAGNGADDTNAVNVDTDGDGLSDGLENFLGTDPNDQDSDDDGVIDGDEPNFADDNDGDGLINALDVDSDDDGLYDGTELGLDCNNPDTDPGPPSHCIPDGDQGATTTNPLLKDTDGGGVSDGSEDSNLDGVPDAGELDPNDGSDDGGVMDSDMDGLSDDLELTLGSDPNDADSDDDGLLDGEEHNPADNNDTDLLINILDVDSDDDGLYDGTEAGKDCSNPDTQTTPVAHCIADADTSTTTSPLDPDTDNGGTSDGSEDSNLNGAVDNGETNPTKGNGADDSDPVNVDTDMDGLSDNLENFIGSDPMDLDSDDDGLLDGDENNPADDADEDGQANANDEDADGDGLFDGTEKGNDCDHPATDTGAGNCIPDGDGGATTTNHLDPDTDGGGVPDGEEDQNGDGVIDPGEGDPNDPSDDGMLECFDDEDCPEDGEVCDIPVNTCVPGCKTDDDCDMDERCEFDPPDEEIGDCVPDDEGTGGGGGTGGTGGAGGDGGAGANANNELAGAVGGCGCTVPGGDDDAPWLLLVAGLAVAGIRRRRRRQLKNAA